MTTNEERALLIGILGVAGAGKDTTADFLVRGHGFTKVALADPLKRICRDVYDFSREQLWGPSSARNAKDFRYPRPSHVMVDGPSGKGIFRSCACCGGDGMEPCFLTPRYALQQLGTEWGRHCYPNTWIDYALRVADKLSVEGGYHYDDISGLMHPWRPGDAVWKTDVVISDVRFKNEVEALRAHGAKLIRIVRPGAGLQGASGAHLSETEQASIPDTDFDAVIRNDGTLVDLAKTVDALMRDWAETQQGAER